MVHRLAKPFPTIDFEWQPVMLSNKARWSPVWGLLVGSSHLQRGVWWALSEDKIYTHWTCVCIYAHIYINDKCTHVCILRCLWFYVQLYHICVLLYIYIYVHIYICIYIHIYIDTYIYIASQLVANLIGKVMMNHWILEATHSWCLTMILLAATGKFGRSNSSASGSPSQIGRAASPAAQWQHLRYGRFKFPDGSARPWGDWVTSRRKPVGVPRSTWANGAETAFMVWFLSIQHGTDMQESGWSRWDSHRMSSGVHSVLGARDVSQGFFRHGQQPNSSHNSPAGDARPRLWSSLFGGWIILPWGVGVRLRLRWLSGTVELSRSAPIWMFKRVGSSCVDWYVNDMSEYNIEYNFICSPLWMLEFYLNGLPNSWVNGFPHFGRFLMGRGLPLS